MPTTTNQIVWNLPLRTRRYSSNAWQAEQRESIISHTVTNVVTKAGPLKGYRQLIAARQSATTPLTGTYHSHRGSSGDGLIRYFRYRIVSGKPEYEGSVASGLVAGTPSMAVFAAPLTSLSRANSLALNRFISKVADAQREMQSFVVLGELGETGRLIRRKSQTLYDGFWAYLNALKKRAKGLRRGHFVQQMIAELWLEYQFALKPLYRDIQSAAYAASKIVNKHSTSLRITAYGDSAATVDLTGHTVTMAGHWTLVKSARQDQYASVRYSGSVSPHLNQMYGNLATLGLTPGEVWGSIWELMPWSFVADYFLNIQEIIESLRWHSTDLDWCERGTKTSQVSYCDSVVFTPSRPGGWFIEEASCDPGQYPAFMKKAVTRENYTGSFTPSLVFEIPGLSTKWLNLLALNRARLQTQKSLSRLG